VASVHLTFIIEFMSKKTTKWNQVMIIKELPNGSATVTAVAESGNSTITVRGRQVPTNRKPGPRKQQQSKKSNNVVTDPTCPVSDTSLDCDTLWQSENGDGEYWYYN
jgi:hypothetical protein